MAIMTITDLPFSRALDYKALSAIRGAGAGDWVLYAFAPYSPPVASVVPVINFYQINNYTADNLTLQTENINVQASAANAAINVGAVQNALTANLAPVTPHT
jgi:hypothetical protein